MFLVSIQTLIDITRECRSCVLAIFTLTLLYHLRPLPQHGQKSPTGQPPSHRRSLHRTLSDESIYRGQRLPCLSDTVAEPALGADVLFSCSTLPRSPTTRGVPLRRPSYKLGVKLHGKIDSNVFRCFYLFTSFTFCSHGSVYCVIVLENRKVHSR